MSKYEQPIKEQKASYKEAVKWARKIHNLCILKPIDITLEFGYTKSNDNRIELYPNICAYTVELSIWDQDTQSHTRARWALWMDDEEIEAERVAVEQYLISKGIKIKK